MLAFTRSDPPTPLGEYTELIIADSDDELVPFGATVELPATPLAIPSPPSIAMSDEARQWTTDTGPWFGWRRTLWIVSGIDLGPSLRERRLRLLLWELLNTARANQPTTTDEAEGPC